VKGDVLSSVNGVTVNTTGEVAGAIATAKKDGRTSVLAKVVRQGRPVFVPLKIAP
jgi:serine protease Do